MRRVEVSNRQQTNYSRHHEKKHQLVESAVTELFWSRDWAERETVGQLRLALRELRHEEEDLQPERKKILPLGWKRFRVKEIKELGMERNRNGAARSMCGGRADGDGRRCLHDSDGSKTWNTVLAFLGSSRGRTTRQILSRMWEPGGGWRQQGVETSNPK